MTGKWNARNITEGVEISRLEVDCKWKDIIYNPINTSLIRLREHLHFKSSNIIVLCQNLLGEINGGFRFNIKLRWVTALSTILKEIRKKNVRTLVYYYFIYSITSCWNRSTKYFLLIRLLLSIHVLWKPFLGLSTFQSL